MSVPAEYMSPPSAGFSVSEPLSGLAQLMAFSQAENICELLKDDELKKIGARAVEEYQQDRSTREDWEKQCEEGLKLAKQVVEEKNWPWANAANVKFPLMSEAAISFSARAYPELVKGEIVKAEVTGNDPQSLKAQRAARVAKFQTWQLRYKMPYWEEETDSLLVQLPLVGNVFRKVYKDPMQGAQARLVRAADFVVNHRVKSLELARRETEVMQFFGNEVEEKMRSGEWRRVSLAPDQKDGIPEEDKPHCILEQHRWLDLDNDGYEEPYIVTVHESSGEVLRIVARFTTDDVVVNQKNEVVKITPQRFYIHYPFIPNPDGGLYAFGLCNLLYPIAESINTVLNQLLDAGTLSNLQGGLIAKGIRIKSGAMRFSPGEWKMVDSPGGTLRDSIVPIPAKEPSVVLFQLLGLLIEAGRGLANLKDVLQGNMPNANVPATTVLALIEQGQMVYSGIYKRIYRAMGKEFKAVFAINAQSMSPEFFQEYASVLDDPQAHPQDFNSKDYDICPVADPATSSQTQRLARAQVLMPMVQVPGMKQDEIVTEYLEAAGFTNVDRFYDPKSAQAQQMQAMQAQMREREVALMAGVADMSAKLAKADAEIVKLKTDSIKNLADAEAKEAGIQLDQYNAQRELLDAQTRARTALATGGQSGPGNPSVSGGVEGMAGAPGNAVVPVGG